MPPVTLQRHFHFAFLIDRSKLTRVLEVMRARVQEAGTHAYEERIIVGSTLPTTATVNTLDEVFELDNSKRNRIRSLEIQCSVSPEEGKPPSRAVYIEFEGQWPAVSVYVKGEPQRWAMEAMAAVEEQAERTEQHGPVPKMKQKSWFGLVPVFLSILMAGAAFGAFLSSDRAPALPMKMWLTEEGIRTIEPSLRDGALLSDEKRAEIVTRQLRNVIREHKNASATIRRETLWLFGFVVIPLVVVLGAVLYVVGTCYPSAVFLWGDAEEWYGGILARRRLIWTAIVLAMTVGVLGNVFVYGIGGLAVR